jgi:hypothetical protein
MSLSKTMSQLEAWRQAKEAWQPPVPPSGLPRHRMGVHWIADQVRQMDKDYMAALSPVPVIKIVNPSRDRVMEALQWIDPAGHVALRYHPISEQQAELEADPVTLGNAHADYWIHQLNTTYSGIDRKRLAVMGINEPTVHTAQQEINVGRYTGAFLNRLRPAGIRAWVFNFSVGWPREVNGRIIWDNLLYLEDLINVTDSFISVHEYGHPHITTHGWGSYGNRISRCPMKCRIIIGECGYTRQLADLPQPWGWNGNISAAAYAQMLWDYADQVDPNRVFAVCPFTTSFGGEEWRSKDTAPAAAEILKRKHNFAWPQGWPIYEAEEPEKNFKLVWPNMPRISQWYGPTHSGLDIPMPVGTPLYAMANGEIAWTDVDTAANGGYGEYIRVRLYGLQFDQMIAHCSRRIHTVRFAKVKRGELLAYSGNTGNSTGPHLHLEIRAKAEDEVNDAAGVGPHHRGQVDPMTVYQIFKRLYGIEHK